MKEYVIKNRFTGQDICRGLAKDFKSFVVSNKSNLSNADLSNANLSNANLSNANLSNAKNIPISCKWIVSFTPQKTEWIENTPDTVLIRIGCKDPQNIEWWDNWFTGSETFDTPRGTEKFKKIYASYVAVREYVKIIFGKD